MEGKCFVIVCKYSSRYIMSCRKFLLNNCFNQIPRNFGPNQFNLAIMSRRWPNLGTDHKVQRGVGRQK